VKLWPLIFLPFILGMAFLGHAALTPKPPGLFGYATVTTREGVNLCVGSFQNCRLLYGHGDKKPRLTVCMTSYDKYNFCPYPKKEKRYAVAP
jgi:hypothetical protein